jgi:hypothetical protein
MPNDLDSLQVEIHTSLSRGKLLDDPLSLPNDDVRVGLPIEYAEAVFSGIGLARGQSTVAPGHLIIDCAAHGFVGSSPVIFQHLGTILLRLLNGRLFEFSDKELVDMFPEEFD